MSEIEDRRQRAREAFEDAMAGPPDNQGGPLLLRAERRQRRAREAAIETATRVRITPELLATMDPAIGNRETRLRAAFTAAGFEVEQ